MKKYLSYVFVIVGAACWGFMGLFNRLLASVGLDMGNRVFVRNFPSLILLTLVFALTRREVFHIQLRHLPIFAASGVISVQQPPDSIPLPQCYTLDEPGFPASWRRWGGRRR